MNYTQELNNARFQLRSGIIMLCLSLCLTSSGWAQTSSPPPARIPAQEKILPDIAYELQEKAAKFKEQLAQIQNELRQTQGETAELANAISTHTAALTVDTITLEHARNLQQHYNDLLQKKIESVQALTHNLEELTKTQEELTQAKNKFQEHLIQLAKTKPKTKEHRTLELRNQKNLKLAESAVNLLEDLKKTLTAQLELLQQQSNSLTEITSKLQTFIDQKFKTQLLERRELSDIFTQIKGLLTESLSLPQRLYAWLWAKLQSGAFTKMLKTYQSQSLGLLLLLGLLIYGAIVLRRASRDLRQKLAAGAATFSLKLIMALINALARTSHLLALTIWLTLFFWTLDLLAHPLAKVMLLGLVVITTLLLQAHFLQEVFQPGLPDKGVIMLDEPTARYYYRTLTLTLSLLIVGYYALLSLNLLAYKTPGSNFALFLGLLFLLFWFARLLKRPHLENLLAGAGLPAGPWQVGILKAVRLGMLLLLSAIVIIDLLGFQNLALFLSGAAVATTLLCLAGWFVIRMGVDLNTYLTHPRDGLLAVKFGFRAENLDTIHTLLQYTFQLTISLLTTAAILFTWGADAAYLRNMLGLLSHGPTLGPVTLSPLALLLAGLSIFFARKLSRMSRHILERRLYHRQGWDIGVQSAISSSVNYTVMALGIIFALGFLGINFSNLAIIVGGLGVGIGFGLQNIANNFISGLILLFERPIKVGDMLVIDGQWGTVKAIRVRSTIFETFERYVLIIPNSDLISGKILNWTFYGRGPNRLALKVGVGYNSNVHEVTRIIDQVCRANERVLLDPPPQVYFNAYGDSSLDFNIWVFVRAPEDRIPATHELNAAIFDAFNAHGIEIPFPQRDLRFRTPLETVNRNQ
ncbi:mechanosensitive ion channel domain-containing protein [Desulfobacca acetoxidans]